MAVTAHAMGSQYSTQSITANTDIRDVSSMLDLWAHKETPFLNKLSWGGDSGGLTIEWVSEHLGWGYVETSAAIASAGASGIFYDPARATTSLGAPFGINEGCLLYTYNSTDGEHGLLLIESTTSAGDTTFEWISGYATSVAASAKFYIIGNFANEGSSARADVSRARSLLSNNFTILRKDIHITGSQAATDMYAVPNELTHQTTLRLLEMQREREMTCLYSRTVARSTTEAALMNGVFGFLVGQSGTHIDITNTTVSESSA